MGNSNSNPVPSKHAQEVDVIKNVLAQDTESFSGGDYTSEAQYNEANANKPYYNEYIQAKTAYLAMKNNTQSGGSQSSCSFKVGDIVKRKSRVGEHGSCDLYGKIISVVESHEFPIGTGKNIPTMYIINCPELFKGTPNEGMKLVLPCCDLELTFDSKHNNL
jgi:hypothetical protein